MTIKNKPKCLVLWLDVGWEWSVFSLFGSFVKFFSMLNSISSGHVWRVTLNLVVVIVRLHPYSIYLIHKLSGFLWWPFCFLFEIFPKFAMQLGCHVTMFQLCFKWITAECGIA
jgi:hypothetical protein